MNFKKEKNEACHIQQELTKTLLTVVRTSNKNEAIFKESRNKE